MTNEEKLQRIRELVAHDAMYLKMHVKGVLCAQILEIIDSPPSSNDAPAGCEGIREKAHDDARELNLANINVASVLATALKDVYTKAKWRAAAVAAHDGLPWKRLLDDTRARLVLTYTKAYVDAVTDRFEEIANGRRTDGVNEV